MDKISPKKKMAVSKKLLLSASVLALSIGTTMSIAYAQCTRVVTRDFECLDHRGEVITDPNDIATYCEGNLGPVTNTYALSRTCPAPCPPPSGGGNGNWSGGDGHGGGTGSDGSGDSGW